MALLGKFGIDSIPVSGKESKRESAGLGTNISFPKFLSIFERLGSGIRRIQEKITLSRLFFYEYGQIDGTMKSRGRRKYFESRGRQL